MVDGESQTPTSNLNPHQCVEEIKRYPSSMCWGVDGRPSIIMLPEAGSLIVVRDVVDHKSLHDGASTMVYPLKVLIFY